MAHDYTEVMDMETVEDLRDSASAMNERYVTLDGLYHTLALRLGLSDSELWILYYLKDNDGCRPRDICREYHLPKQTVDSALKKLERQDVLARETKTPRDVRITLTAKGRKLVRERILPICEAEVTAIDALPAKDRLALFKLLDKYSDHLREQFDAISEPERG